MSTDDTPPKTNQRTDPSVVTAGAVFRKKWIPVIVHRLQRYGPLGFSALCDRVDGISSKVLSENLEEMENRGLIEREIVNDRPLRVEYSLTERGRSLGSVVEALIDWAREFSYLE